MTHPPHLHYDEGSENDRQRRLTDTYRRLGTSEPECFRSDCNERDPFALVGFHPEVLCYEHDRVANGLNPIEADHRAGQRNDPMTLMIPGNDHRVLSDMQIDWPRETLHNPNKSPLIRVVAMIRGFLDLLWLLIMRILPWIFALENLDRLLVDAHGTDWWDALGWVTP